MDTDIHGQKPIDPTDSLAEMKAEISSAPEYSDNTMKALNEMQDVNLTANVSTEAVDRTASIQVGLLRVVDSMMGEFLDSLKSVDASFAECADVYFAQASMLAEKKDLNDDEMAEVVGNIVIGGAIKGVGNIWKAVKTDKHLNSVKAILAREGEAKVETLQAMKGLFEVMIDIIADRLWDTETYEDAKIYFDELRLQRYLINVNDYLLDSYRQAMSRNEFTALPFPSYYRTNQDILFSYLTSPERASSENAVKENRRQAVESLVEGVREAVTSGRAPDVSEFILASDSQIMAVAINTYLDVNMFSEIYSEFDDDSHDVMPESLYNMEIFENLYYEAEETPESQLSKFVLNNEALERSVLHSEQADDVDEKFNQRILLFRINCGIVAVAFFLGAMVMFDWAWYWCTAVGIVAGLIAFKMSPESPWEGLCQAKTVCIQRKLVLDNLNEAGYVETINISELASGNKKLWLWVIVGAIVGLITPVPLGWLWGALLGGWLGSPGSSKKFGDYDYTAIRLGSGWKAQTVSAVFTALIVYFLYLLIH